MQETHKHTKNTPARWLKSQPRNRLEQHCLSIKMMLNVARKRSMFPSFPCLISPSGPSQCETTIKKIFIHLFSRFQSVCHIVYSISRHTSLREIECCAYYLFIGCSPLGPWKAKVIPVGNAFVCLATEASDLLVTLLKTSHLSQWIAWAGMEVILSVIS